VLLTFVTDAMGFFLFLGLASSFDAGSKEQDPAYGRS
jgi:Mg/Co/Ni transporter MgtE